MNPVLQQRVNRIKGRVELHSQDLYRAMHWHILGGKQRFNSNMPKLLNEYKWCFICGCNNSGTSLLQSMLDKTGQTSALEHEGQRYTRVLERGSRRGHERVWSEFLDDVRLDSNATGHSIPRLLHDWFTEMPHPVKPIIVEKTTMNAVRMPWLQEAFPNSLFIGLVRNGYAVTEGILRKGNKPVDRGARHWNMVNKIMVEDSKRIDHYLPITYEALVDSPTDSAEKIANFIGIEPDSMNGSINDSYTFNTVLGNQSQGIKNMNSECIASLSDKQIRTIRNEAEEMLDYYGY